MCNQDQANFNNIYFLFRITACRDSVTNFFSRNSGFFLKKRKEKKERTNYIEK